MQYDYIVVGGGSAGCVAAWRLVEEFGAKVLLLEAGGPYSSLLLKLTPGYVKILSGDKYITHHTTTPQKQLDSRCRSIETGYVLGGGSSVNAQVYMRGHKADYDSWQDTTASNLWSWEKLLPHYLKLEGNHKFNNQYHGIDGPLKVSDPGFICEFSNVFVKTLQGMGLPFTADFNNGAPAGVGFVQITAKAGRRCSAVDAYLRPLKRDGNLSICTGAQVNRIIVERGRAIGVEYNFQGRILTAHCDDEVLLAAGAFGSPKILMLSGIGPSDHLHAFGIEVVSDLPGVGRNLQDHVGAPIIAAANSSCPKSYGYYRQDRGWRMLLNGLEYAAFKRGRITTAGGEACSFHVPDKGDGDPIVQIWCSPTVKFSNTAARKLPDVNGLRLHSVLLRPRSRGWVRLRSADPKALPVVNPNYLGEPEDMRNLLDGVKIARQILQSCPLSDLVNNELLPGKDIVSDSDLTNYIRQAAVTDWHPAGSCRMGRKEDVNSVVDPELRVYGITGLRVIDASIMPNIVSANTNAPTMAISHRAISFVRNITTEI